MATKIKQITEEVGLDGVLFGSWLAQQGLDRQQQSEHLQSGWLERIARGVYKIAESHPTLYSAVSCYNTQLGKQCIVGARSALDLRGFMHYVPMGKAVAFLFTDNAHKLPEWLLQYEWDMTVQYQTTSFLGDDMLGVETQMVDGRSLLVSSPECRISSLTCARTMPLTIRRPPFCRLCPPKDVASSIHAAYEPPWVDTYFDT